MTEPFLPSARPFLPTEKPKPFLQSHAPEGTAKTRPAAPQPSDWTPPVETSPDMQGAPTDWNAVGQTIEQAIPGIVRGTVVGGAAATGGALAAPLAIASGPFAPVVEAGGAAMGAEAGRKLLDAYDWLKGNPKRESVFQSWKNSFENMGADMASMLALHATLTAVGNGAEGIANWMKGPTKESVASAEAAPKPAAPAQEYRVVHQGAPVVRTSTEAQAQEVAAQLPGATVEPHVPQPPPRWEQANATASPEAQQAAAAVKPQPIAADQQLQQAATASPEKLLVPAGEPGPSGMNIVPPDKVHGFSTQIMSVDQEVRNYETNLLRAGGGFTEARRSGMTRAQIGDAAKNAGIGEQTILQLPKGSILNAEQARQADQVLQDAGRQAIDTAKLYLADPANAELRAASDTQQVRAAALVQKTFAVGSEQGRALGDRRFIGEPQRNIQKALDNISAGRVPGAADSLAKAKLIASLDDPVQAAKLAQYTTKPNWWDKAYEFWINGLVSGPQTFMRVNASQALLTAWSPVERAGTAAVGMLHGGENAYPSEVAAYVAGAFDKIPEAFAKSWEVFKTGNEIGPQGDIAAGTGREAIAGLKGKIVRSPINSHKAASAFYQIINMAGENQALATRQAISEGLTGAEKATRIAELSANPTPEMQAQAWKRATGVSFRTPLSEQTGFMANLARAYRSLGEKHPVLRVISPFLTIGTNITKAALTRGPLAPIVADWRAAVAAGGVQRDEALAKMALGTAFTAAFIPKVLDGTVTGAAPSDPAGRDLWDLQHKQSYSIKVGDTWYRYSGLEPFGFMLGNLADFVEVARKSSSLGETGKVLTAIVGSTSHTLLGSSFMTGPQTFMQAITSPDQYLANYVRSMAGTLIPNAVKQTAQGIDPTLRQARGLIDSMLVRIPVLSEGYQPRLNLWGNPIVREGSGPYVTISPIYRSTDPHDKVANEMSRLGVAISLPQPKISGVRLSPKAYNEYVELAGRPAKALLDRFVNSPAWSSYTDAMKVGFIEKVIGQYRDAARQQMELKYGDLFNATLARGEVGPYANRLNH